MKVRYMFYDHYSDCWAITNNRRDAVKMCELSKKYKSMGREDNELDKFYQKLMGHKTKFLSEEICDIKPYLGYFPEKGTRKRPKIHKLTIS